MKFSIATLAAVLIAASLSMPTSLAGPTVGNSPWGPEDEIGRLNMMTDQTRLAILARIKGEDAPEGKVELTPRINPGDTLRQN